MLWKKKLANIRDDDIISVDLDDIFARNLIGKLSSVAKPWITCVVHEAIKFLMTTMRAIRYGVKKSTNLLFLISAISWPTLRHVDGLSFVQYLVESLIYPDDFIAFSALSASHRCIVPREVHQSLNFLSTDQRWLNTDTSCSH